MISWPSRRRREQEERDYVAFLARRRYLDEDVTAFGEQLSELHVDSPFG